MLCVFSRWLISAEKTNLSVHLQRKDVSFCANPSLIVLGSGNPSQWDYYFFLCWFFSEAYPTLTRQMLFCVIAAFPRSRGRSSGKHKHKYWHRPTRVFALLTLWRHLLPLIQSFHNPEGLFQAEISFISVIICSTQTLYNRSRWGLFNYRNWKDFDFLWQISGFHWSSVSSTGQTALGKAWRTAQCSPN